LIELPPGAGWWWWCVCVSAGGSTHTIGQEGGGLYDISLPVRMPGESYAVFKIDASN
jgi:hypothetical protein